VSVAVTLAPLPLLAGGIVIPPWTPRAADPKLIVCDVVPTTIEAVAEAAVGDGEGVGVVADDEEAGAGFDPPPPPPHAVSTDSVTSNAATFRTICSPIIRVDVPTVTYRFLAKGGDFRLARPK
jgi:hypothetical protein